MQETFSTRIRVAFLVLGSLVLASGCYTTTNPIATLGLLSPPSSEVGFAALGVVPGLPQAAMGEGAEAALLSAYVLFGVALWWDGGTIPDPSVRARTRVSGATLIVGAASASIIDALLSRRRYARLLLPPDSAF